MLGLSLIVLVLSVSQCVLSQPLPLSDAEIQQLVNAHNFFRGMVDPPASNMQRVRWNEELARVAQAYAEMCQFRDNPNRADNVSFPTVGENLSASNTRTPNYTEFVERSWFNQRGNYDYETNMCSSPGSCTDYVQLVWADTTEIGCGVARCPVIAGFPLPNSILLVCNYAPEGRIEDGRPYIEGNFCSNCAEGFVCVRNLCTLLPPITTPPPTTTATLSTTTSLPPTETTVTVPPTTTAAATTMATQATTTMVSPTTAELTTASTRAPPQTSAPTQPQTTSVSTTELTTQEPPSTRVSITTPPTTPPATPPATTPTVPPITPTSTPSQPTEPATVAPATTTRKPPKPTRPPVKPCHVCTCFYYKWLINRWRYKLQMLSLRRVTSWKKPVGRTNYRYVVSTARGINSVRRIRKPIDLYGDCTKPKTGRSKSNTRISKSNTRRSKSTRSKSTRSKSTRRSKSNTKRSKSKSTRRSKSNTRSHTRWSKSNTKSRTRKSKSKSKRKSKGRSGSRKSRT